VDAPAELVGREPALARMRAPLDRLLAGTGALLLLGGDAGIGKTTLARALATEAAAKGVRVLWGACWPGESTPAYWPWTQILRDVAGSHRVLPGRAAALVTGSAGHADVASSSSGQQPPALTDPTARFELHDAVARALGELAEETPLAVVFDDLHWADVFSIELLDFVARHSRGRALLLVGTYRESEAGSELHRLAGADGMTLGGLDETAVAAIVASVTGAEPSPDVVVRMWRRTGGNPLFVRELSRLLVARGDTSIASTSIAGLPVTVRETLEHRLARLSSSCREMLCVAALLDAPTEDVLAHVCPPDLRRALPSLVEEAVQARVLLLRSGVGEPVRFSHDLFRETVLAAIPPHERLRLHVTVADALAALSMTTSAVTSREIATHFMAARQLRPADALRWSVAAAEEATTRLAYADAARHYGDASTVLDAGGPVEGVPSRTALLLRLAAAEACAGVASARDRFWGAAQAARADGDTAAMAEAALGLHALGARSPTAHARNVALLREVIDGRPVEPPLRARLLAALARELRHSMQQPAAALEAAEQAVAMARGLDVPAVLAECLLALHDTMWRPGAAAVRREVADDMATAAQVAGDPELFAQATVLRASCLLELGDPRGRSALATYCDLADDLGHARGRWEALSRRATLALIDGRVGDADELAADARRLGTEMGLPDAVGVDGTLRWQLSRFRGDRTSLAEDLRELDVPVRPAFATIALADTGDLASARREASRLSVADQQDKYDLEYRAALAEGVTVAGSDEQRRAAYDDLAPYAGSNIVVGGCASFWGPVDLYLGDLAAVLGDAEVACRHFETAEQMARELGAPLWAELARAKAGQSATVRVGDAANAFRRDGDVWTLRFDDVTAHLPDAKGLRDIAVLLAQPRVEVSATKLLTGVSAAPGADPVLDERAKTAYRRRLAELDAAIDEADAADDTHRAEAARAERAALVAELTAAAGLGGRTRRLGDERERARKAVTSRIRDAIERVERVHPALGGHLRAAVRTGGWCSYQPAEDAVWQL
jgi:hypothetical protein